MDDQNEIFRIRQKKIEHWEKKGFSGYATHFERNFDSNSARDFCEKNSLREVSEILKTPKKIAKMPGRILQMREMGALIFLRIRDGAGDFQICLAKEWLADDFSWFAQNLDLGDFCGFEGEFFRTKKNEPTLLATEFFPLVKSLRPLPQKWGAVADRELCYRQRNLDLALNPETFDRFSKRSQMVREIREFFWDKNFLEVETPILNEKAGGAMAEVFRTHHRALDHDFVLRIALEIDQKRILGGGFERVFEIGKCFRNEGIDPSHLQEFTSIEWYSAYTPLAEHEEWISTLLPQIAKNVFGKTKFEILDKDQNRVEIDFDQPFQRFTFAELLEKYAGIDLFTISEKALQDTAEKLGIEDFHSRSRGNVLDDIYKKTVRPHLQSPTFVVDWPSDLKPLARPKNAHISEVSQLLIAGWEITNGYSELIDPLVQRKLLQSQQAARERGDTETMELDHNFLTAMEHGFPPMAGHGMGIDRLCALLTAQPNLRDVVFFPTMKSENSIPSKKEKTKISVVILNASADLSHWQTHNSVAHLTAALGARVGKNLFFADEITTADGQKIQMNTQHAIILKTASDSAELKKVLADARIQNLETAEFTRQMLETSDDAKIIRTARTQKYDEIEHLGVLVFGEKNAVEKLTAQFSLLK